MVGGIGKHATPQKTPSPLPAGKLARANPLNWSKEGRRQLWRANEVKKRRDASQDAINNMTAPKIEPGTEALSFLGSQEGENSQPALYQLLKAIPLPTEKDRLSAKQKAKGDKWLDSVDQVIDSVKSFKAPDQWDCNEADKFCDTADNLFAVLAEDLDKNPRLKEVLDNEIDSEKLAGQIFKDPDSRQKFQDAWQKADPKEKLMLLKKALTGYAQAWKENTHDKFTFSDLTKQDREEFNSVSDKWRADNGLDAEDSKKPGDKRKFSEADMYDDNDPEIGENGENVDPNTLLGKGQDPEFQRAYKEAMLKERCKQIQGEQKLSTVAAQMGGNFCASAAGDAMRMSEKGQAIADTVANSGQNIGNTRDMRQQKQDQMEHMKSQRAAQGGAY